MYWSRQNFLQVNGDCTQIGKESNFNNLKYCWAGTAPGAGSAMYCCAGPAPGGGSARYCFAGVAPGAGYAPYS